MDNAQVHWYAYYLIKTIIILNIQWGKWGLESWSDLPKITQVVPVKAQSPAVCAQCSNSEPFSYTVS